MAVFAFTDAYVSINAVDLSDHVKAVRLTYEAEMLDDTTMGKATRTMTPGLLNYTIEVDFLQDFAAGEVDATLFSLVGASAFAVAIRPVNTTIATTNPEFQGNVVLATYPILNNTVGELAVASCTFQPSGASPTLIRDTTP